MTLLGWLEDELRRRGIELTRDDIERITRIIEEREWISIHPELYRRLMEDASKTLSTEINRAKEEIEAIKNRFKDTVQMLKVNSDIRFNELSAIGSDASRCPMPLLIARSALVSGIALRHPSDNPPSILEEVLIVLPSEMSGTSFRFYVSAKCESLIPLSVQHQLLNYKPPGIVVIDGPLSISQWYREIPRRAKKVVEVIDEFIDAKSNLMKLCYEMDIPLIGVVKRGRSRYFHNYSGLADESHYSDQYVFHQMLNYGFRTSSISITEAIIKWRKKAKPKELLITRLPFEIYGFYIKTSKNPLTPPIRVEYPSYLKDHEDWIANYVLSTAVQTYDSEFDGLPFVQCLAHRDAKIAGRIMWEVYKQRLYEISKTGENLSLIAPSKGYSPK